MRESVFLIALAIVAFTAVTVVKAIEEAESTLASQSAQIAALQERLDFTERLLAQGRDRTALGPGSLGS